MHLRCCIAKLVSKSVHVFLFCVSHGARRLGLYNCMLPHVYVFCLCEVQCNDSAEGNHRRMHGACAGCVGSRAFLCAAFISDCSCGRAQLSVHRHGLCLCGLILSVLYSVHGCLSDGKRRHHAEGSSHFEIEVGDKYANNVSLSLSDCQVEAAAPAQ